MTKSREPKTRRPKKPKARLLKKLVIKSTGKSGGRNSGGRITSFHRGGGSKSLQRSIDLKRNTPSTGVVERIEYDPNRSSRVALVRWIDGVNLLRCRHVADSQPSDENVSSKDTIPSAFSVSESFKFNTLPENYFGSVGGKNVIATQSKCLGKDYVMIGGVPKKSFSFIRQGHDASVGGENLWTASVDSIPRIAVAGARPKYFSVEKTGQSLIGKNTTLGEIEKWKAKCLDRKYAIPWQSITLSEKRPEGSNLLPRQLVTFGLGKNTSVFNRNVLPKIPVANNGLKDCVPVSYITASDKLEEGSTVMNCDWSKSTRGQNVDGGLQDISYERLDINSQIGNCIPLKDIRMGTFVHDIECRPGQGAKLVRAAGTYAKVIKEQNSKCLIRLPSGVEKLLDSRCRATVGVVSNPDHGMQKLKKAGQKRWLGRRPVVRGVAMNPIDHPHGGGEGRTKGGRPSVSPWGKPTKAGFKTVLKVVGKGRV